MLGKIVISDNDIAKKRTFYTSLYHTFISPNLISDVDGKYYLEGKIRTSKIPQYSNYSTWDTYRALHPLLTIIEQNKTVELVNSMVSRHADEGLILPGWEAQGFDNICMIGYNMTSPIADAILKDIPGIDVKKAYSAVYAAAFDKTKSSPNYDVNGMDGYLKYGYVTGEIGSSVSKTAEQNYYDWAIAKVAEKLGMKDDAEMFDKRSAGWRNLFDKETGYLIPKMSSGKKITLDTTTWKDLIRNYVSGNIWAYSAYTPHDMKAVMQLHGGRKEYLNWLDDLFNNDSEVGGAQHVDISGFIGKYGHGDEPGHQMPYLFNIAGESWKTQKYVNEVITTMYSDKPDGMVNNEDLGQMSAWYIFSTLGFYPLAPGDLVYQFGAPYYSKATINLENGNSFAITAKNLSNQNIYVQRVYLNGREYHKTFITHEKLMEGGEIVFEMGSDPNESRGTDMSASSLGEFDDHLNVEILITGTSAPYDLNSNRYFEGEYAINLASESQGAQIYYTLDGTDPDRNSTLYENPILINGNTSLKAVSFKEGLNSSTAFEKSYFESFLLNLKEGYPVITVQEQDTPYGLADCSMLFDQFFGSESYSDGKWTGIKGDFDITLDLGELKSLNEISIGALTDTGVWIFPPDNIEIFGGNTVSKLTPIAKRKIDKLETDEKRTERYEFELNGTGVQYLRIKINNYGIAPAWHGAGRGKKMWLFVDEIVLS